MPAVLFISALLVSAAAASNTAHLRMVAEIASLNLSWTADENSIFADWSNEQLRSLMGTQLPSLEELSAKTLLGTDLGDMPKNFDARTEFSSCIHPIRNQLSCGSCWAFGAAETLTDNLCVAGNAAVPVLSPQDLVSCDTTDNGCNGGTLPNAWDYIHSKGLVSDACMPYTAGNGTRGACPSMGGCTDGSGDPKTYKCDTKANFLSMVSDIKQGVMSLGSAETGFYVYEDFMKYKSGIYKHTTGQVLGGHAVKIVGWGEESEQKYWLVANSWGTSWGEDGYFRISFDDKDSGFALGGAFNCGGVTPVTAPTPPPSPSACVDILDKCSEFKSMCKEGGAGECLKTCGCCDQFNKPSYCPNK